MTRFLFVMTLAAGASMVFGADAPQASMGKVLDAQLRSAEREIVVPYIGERIAQDHVLLDAQRARLVRH